MLEKINDFWKWLQKNFTNDYRDEIEKYLAESTDLYDLEARMKRIQMRGMI